ncbi:hypothetical protein [Floridanema evergladense]|uniref:Uncharacterized protein n=1 Tax=Floridaenema evergladense BLCC-F167 TaxID=3153639 RepID=A0ABV4WMV2_9CYAN
MAYSDFKLNTLIKDFGLTLQEVSQLFANVPEVASSEILQTLLQENVDLAVSINTEKARSEMIISPVLLEIRRRFNYNISLFSGIDFNVDNERGLNGFCDFLISRSKEQLFIGTPVIAVVEAKNENLKSGLGQCVAEMLGVQIFNQREGNEVKTIYGTVTTGTIWQFLQLEGNVVSIDLSEYYISDIGKILGILTKAVNG